MRSQISQYFNNLKATLDALSMEVIDDIANTFLDAREAGRTIYVFGNGGSGSTASHMACDIGKGCSYGQDKRFKIICLNDNIPTLLAYSNDVGFEVVFEEQLRNVLLKGDVVVAISGSGNSPNIIKAIRYANAQGAKTIGLSGFDGGELHKLADIGLHVPIHDMQISEDIHLMTNHILFNIFNSLD